MWYEKLDFYGTFNYQNQRRPGISVYSYKKTYLSSEHPEVCAGKSYHYLVFGKDERENANL